MLGWIACFGLTILLFAVTAYWIARDYRKTKAKLAPLPPPTVIGRLDDAETLMNAKMSELQELHEQSIKGMKFDPNFKPPPDNPLDAKAEELRRMTEKRTERKQT
jgi:hypothetical protein